MEAYCETLFLLEDMVPLLYATKIAKMVPFA